MASNNTAIIIIGLVLIVALVMSGPISIGFSEFIDRLWDTWGNIFDFDATGNGFLKGQGSIAVTIFYEDGTHKDYELSTFSILPLSIVCDDKIVDRFEMRVNVRLNYDLPSSDWQISSWEAKGDFITTVRPPVFVHHDSVPFTKQGTSTIPDPIIAYEVTIKADTIEGWLKSGGHDYGTYMMTCEVHNSKGSATFKSISDPSDTVYDTISGAGHSIIIDFSWNEDPTPSLTSIRVTIIPETLT